MKNMDAGYWMLDTGYWMLDACLPSYRLTRWQAGWMLDTGCLPAVTQANALAGRLDAGYWILDTGYDYDY